MNKTEFENFLTKYTREEITNYFFSSKSEDDFREHYNLSHANMRELKKLYALFYSKEQVAEKRRSTWKNKSESYYKTLIKKVNKDDLINYYIIQNNTFDDTYLHFDITKNDLLYLLKYYNCKKPKTKSNIICKNTKLKKYNNENYNNRDKAEVTCLKKYGVENPFQSEELMKNSYDKKESIYGIGNANNWIKNHETRIKNSGSIVASYENAKIAFKQTCLEKYGVDNVSKDENIKAKIKDNTRKSFIDKYGVECYWQTDNAKRSFNSINSKPNLHFKELLISNNLFISDDINTEFSILNRSYDFKIGNNLIEINPFATHNSTWSPFGEKWVKSKSYHFDKSKLARDNGYRCICVWDWDDEDKIINLLKDREKVYARNCEIKEVPKSEAKEFINKYHIQNYAKDSIRLGLYYNDKLVSIMTFDKPRYNKKYEYELIRYCSSMNVIGGAEKIFSHFNSIYNPNSIISYCDLSKFDGKTYDKLGFKLNKISISKHWYNPKTGEHITDNLLRQRGFDQLFGTSYGKGTSNVDLMLEAGFVEIYDCGQATYIIE